MLFRGPDHFCVLVYVGSVPFPFAMSLLGTFWASLVSCNNPTKGGLGINLILDRTASMRYCNIVNTYAI